MTKKAYYATYLNKVYLTGIICMKPKIYQSKRELDYINDAVSFYIVQPTVSRKGKLTGKTWWIYTFDKETKEILMNIKRQVYIEVVGSLAGGNNKVRIVAEKVNIVKKFSKPFFEKAQDIWRLE